MPSRKTHEQFVAEVKALVSDEYEVLQEYTLTNVLIKMKHHGDCGETFSIKPAEFLRGHRCKVCRPHFKRKFVKKNKVEETSH